MNFFFTYVLLFLLANSALCFLAMTFNLQDRNLAQDFKKDSQIVQDR